MIQCNLFSMPGKLCTSTAKQASEFNKLPAPQGIKHTLALFFKENKLLQSSNLANRLKSYWRKEGFSKITKNNIISIILLIPRWLGWAQNQHPPCPYWADLCSCHFLFGYSQLVAQDTDACPPRAHLAATHFFSNCSITASKSSYSFVLSCFWASVSCFWALEAAALSYQSWKCSKPF